jgi:hypothetical protein
VDQVAQADLRELVDLVVHQDLPEQADLPELVDLVVQVDLQVHPDHLELVDLQEHQVQVEHLVLLVMMVLTQEDGHLHQVQPHHLLQDLVILILVLLLL